MVTPDERLLMIASLIKPCDTVADIGADHGQLGVYLLQRGLCRSVQFLDISAPSLNKARRLVRLCGLENQAEFGVGDGAEAMTRLAGAVVIAGLGANTIIDIISRGQDKLGNAALILQPNLGVEELRRALCDSGYIIEDERIARAAGRHYVGLRAVRGEAHYSEKDLIVGPVLLQKGGEALLSYARFRVKVLTRALEGAQKSDQARAGTLSRELSVWKDVLSS